MEKIFKAESTIEQATSQLFRLEDVLEEVCQSIKVSLGFDFVGISLVSQERNTIEAVHGIGIATEWSGRAKHYLEQDENLRDIQADIVQTVRTKIISGWNKRFDRWIYEEFNHERLIRIYTPILLIQDKNGHVIENWIEKYQWKEISINEAPEGKCKVFDGLMLSDEFEVIPIGTVEAGYEDRTREISDETVSQLVKLLSQKALDIRKTQLPWVLKIITEEAKDIMNADSATLHFLYEPTNNNYLYEVFSGKVGWHFLKNCPPRRDGLGRKAISEGRYKYISNLSPSPTPSKLKNEEVWERNEKALESGIKSLAAFPLQVDSEYDYKNVCQSKRRFPKGGLFKEGVLYVHFQKEHQFKDEELRWGQLFTNRAADAISHATTYAQRRDYEQLLTTLHSVAQTLARVPKKDVLLRRIAWDTLNILAADIVTIYEYNQTAKEFYFPPEIAGRLKAQKEMEDRLNQHNVPFLFVERGDNSYVSNLNIDEIFNNAPFSKRENIQAVAGILLKVGNEIVGVMFVNYRRLHDFTSEEKKIIETLASSAAIAIKNQRWLSARSDIDRKLITTLDRNDLLDLIVEQVVQLTRANFGCIRLLDLDPSKERLVVEAKYPKTAEINESRIHTSLNEGITGLVARSRQSALVDDINSDVWRKYYTICFPDVQSELCVPLLDKDSGLLGVLNVESCQIRAFDEKHQQMLETFADQAVIGIQNVRNKEQLLHMNTLVTLGDLASPLLHKMKGQLGAIKEWSKDIIEGYEHYKEKAERILSAADNLLQERDRLKIWTNDKPEKLDISEIVKKALNEIEIPRNIVEDISLADNLQQLSAGKIQLVNVFNNLIQNAIDAMPDGGKLSIHANSFQRDGYIWVKVEICDTGFGIDKDSQKEIFQPSYTTKNDEKGTGFGLWWTKFYIQRLKGHIDFDSEINEGTKFIVILPCCELEK